MKTLSLLLAAISPLNLCRQIETLKTPVSLVSSGLVMIFVWPGNFTVSKKWRKKYRGETWVNGRRKAETKGNLIKGVCISFVFIDARSARSGCLIQLHLISGQWRLHHPGPFRHPHPHHNHHQLVINMLSMFTHTFKMYIKLRHPHLHRQKKCSR